MIFGICIKHTVFWSLRFNSKYDFHSDISAIILLK